jgi:TPR repeat protein
LAALLLLLAAGGGAYWYLNQRTGGDAPVAATDEAKPKAGQGNSPPLPAKASIETLRDVNAFLQSATSAEAAFAEAQDLLKRGKKDLSLLLFQHAARGGSQEANVAMARFYDPATWSTDTSPMPQADAETAAYWYEPAAEAGNVEAQRRLGKILADLNMGGGQREKALEWLHKAASAGDTEADKLLETLK